MRALKPQSSPRPCWRKPDHSLAMRATSSSSTSADTPLRCASTLNKPAPHSTRPCGRISAATPKPTGLKSGKRNIGSSSSLKSPAQISAKKLSTSSCCTAISALKVGEDAVERGEKGFRRIGFGQETGAAYAQAAGHFADGVQRFAVISGNDQQGGAIAEQGHVLDEVYAVHARHADIGDDQVITVLSMLRSASAGSLNSSMATS